MHSFLKNVYFFQRKTAIANWKPTYSSTPILFFKFRSDLLIYYLNKPPLSPLNVYHLLVLNPSKEIAPAYYLQVLALLLLPKNAKHNSIVHLKGSNRQK